MKPLMPTSIASPMADYSHGMEVPAGHRLVLTSGQIGLAKNGTVPEDAEGQAKICFQNISAILAEAGAGPEHVIRLNTFVTDRSHMAGYMKARDAWLEGYTHRPASTLVIISGFSWPEFVVEVEATAAVPV